MGNVLSYYQEAGPVNSSSLLVVPAAAARPRPAAGTWTSRMKDSASSPYCAWFFHTTKQDSGTGWVSYPPALCWRSLPEIASDPTGSGLRPTRLPNPDFRCQLPLSPIAGPLRQAGWRSEVPTTAFCASVHSPEQLTELRNRFLTRSLAYTKGSDSEAAG